MRFAIFPVHLSKVVRLPWKSDARTYEVLRLSRKIISANLKIGGSKVQPLSGNQRPDLLTALMNMSLVLRLPRKMHLSRFSSNVPRLPSFFQMLQNPLTFCSLLTRSTIPCTCHAKWHLNVQTWREHVMLLTFWRRNVLRATTACTFSTSQLPKSGPILVCFLHFDFEACFAPQRRALFRHRSFQKWSEPGVSCNVLTWKCASRHNTVHFFDISTSKSGPILVCFVHFDFKASRHNGVPLFRHLNFQTWSEHGVSCTFWLGNVLRATTACNFSSLIWPAGSAPAALASLLFDPLEP